MRYWIWEVNGRSVGFCQDYRIADHPEYALLCGRPDAIGFDYVIGEAAYVDRGLGTSLLWVFLRDIVVPAYDGASELFAAPDHRNTRSLRVLEKLGATQGTVVRRAQTGRAASTRSSAAASTCAGCCDGHDPCRHLRVDLPALAWRLLPEGTAATPRAGVRRLAADLDRDQRLVLLAATARRAGRSGAREVPGRLRLRGQGRPLHHPHEAPARRRGCRWPTSSPRACWPSATRSDRSCGSCPATFAYDHDVLAEFFSLLPRTTTEAARLATAPRRPAVRRQALVGRGRRTTAAPRPRAAAPRLREPTRHSRSSRSADVALVVADSAGKWPRFEQAIGPIVYVRLHGDKELYASGYTDAALDRWAEQLQRVDRRRPGRLRLLRQRHEGLRAARRTQADRAARRRREAAHNTVRRDPARE